MTHPGRTVGRWIWIFAAFCALANPSGASCLGQQFGQVSSEYGYHYVLLPDGSTGEFASMVGRFWSPGTGPLEGQCDESFWLERCDPTQYPCGGGTAGRAFYINGTFGAGCGLGGCPTSEMITLIEDTSIDGTRSFFAVGRVDATPAHALLFDDSRIGRDWSLVEIPKPGITASAGMLGISIPDPASGFYGLPGDTAARTITAMDLYVAHPPVESWDPGRRRELWSLAQRYPYTGGVTTGTYPSPCGGPYDATVFATAIEFEDGRVVTDFVSAKTSVKCPLGFPGAGPVPDGSLTVGKAGAGQLVIAWGASCSSSDYAIYEGVLGNYYSHYSRFCTTGRETTATIAAAEGSTYYLVVASVLSGPTLEYFVEGSYGTDTQGAERPQGAPACFGQYLHTCP